MIVGFHGKMGSGKNEAARRLALLSPIEVVEISYARKLKESAAALLGCAVDDLEIWKGDSTVHVVIADETDFLHAQTVRSFLQRYGTEAHRDVFGADFWLDAALPVDREYDDKLYAITDVRFENEASRIRELGGIVVGLIGPVTDTGRHRSEQAMHCDLWIANGRRDDDFAALDKQLQECVLTPLGIAA